MTGYFFSSSKIIFVTAVKVEILKLSTIETMKLVHEIIWEFDI